MKIFQTSTKLPKIIQIHNIKVTLHRRLLTKNLRLRIDPINKVPILIAPKRITLEQAQLFLRQHYKWILEQIDALTTHLPKNQTLFAGQHYQIVHESTSTKRLIITFDHENKLISHNSCENLIQMRLKNFFKKQAFEIIQQHCLKFANEIGVCYSEIQIRDYRGRWGSCKLDGRLSFSWRLIMAPPEVLKYVCAHEVAHLIHMNHSPMFWELVSSIMPSYKQWKTWLKENGTILFQQF